MNPNSRKSYSYPCPNPEPQKITHVDGEYELIAFEEVKSGDTLRIEYPTVIPTTTGPLLVTSHVDLHMIDEVLLQPINNGHESVIHAFPKGHGKKIYRLIPALPTEAGSLIQIWKVSNYFNPPLPSGTLAQLFIGKFGLPHWGYLDHDGIQHVIDSECIDKWAQVYLTTTPNA